MEGEVQHILDRLLEIQIEQNELARRLARAEVSRNVTMHAYFAHGATKDVMDEHRRVADLLRDQFEKNQERLRKLWAEVMKATVSAVPTIGGGVPS